jgi:hypothetical protein
MRSMELSRLFNSFWFRWGLAFLVMVLIFAFSSIPSNEMPDFGMTDVIFKKAGHMLGYGLLAVAYLHAIGKQRPHARWLAWLLAIGYGMTDELHQAFVPGRNAWIVDVGIDALGALIALMLTRLRD